MASLPHGYSFKHDSPPSWKKIPNNISQKKNQGRKFNRNERKQTNCCLSARSPVDPPHVPIQTAKLILQSRLNYQYSWTEYKNLIWKSLSLQSWCLRHGKSEEDMTVLTFLKHPSLSSLFAINLYVISRCIDLGYWFLPRVSYLARDFQLYCWAFRAYVAFQSSRPQWLFKLRHIKRRIPHFPNSWLCMRVVLSRPISHFSICVWDLYLYVLFHLPFIRVSSI